MIRRRFVEAFLGALGARVEFRDAILGDLAEEFVARAARDDIQSATRWYIREAIRAVPHLLRDWTRQIRARDVRDLAGVVAASLISVGVLALFANAAIDAVIPGIREVPVLRGSNGVLTVVALTVGGLGAVAGGYLAARLHARAPLIGAGALAVAWSCLTVIGLMLAPGNVRAAYRVGAPLSVLLGTLVGGVLCTGSRARA